MGELLIPPEDRDEEHFCCFTTPFTVDKSPLLKVWWQQAQEQPISLIFAPPGFGKTSILKMIECFFGKPSMEERFKSCEIGQDKRFFRSHQGKYTVTMVDFSQTSGESYSDGVKVLTGRRNVRGDQFCLSLPKSDIYLIDNIDAFVMGGFIDDYHGEAWSFTESFLTCLLTRKTGSKVLMTASCGFFLRNLIGNTDVPVHIYDMHESNFSPFLGFQLGVLKNIMEDLHFPYCCVSFEGVVRKFGGYHHSDKNTSDCQLIHAGGLVRFLGKKNVKESAEANAFDPVILLLIEIFRQMNLSHLDLIKLIHSRHPIKILRPSHFSEVGSSSEEDGISDDLEFSIYDFISILHDFGILARVRNNSAKQPLELAIPNADAKLILIRISNIFMQEIASNSMQI